VRNAIGRSCDDEALCRELSRYARWPGLRPADFQVQRGGFRSSMIAVFIRRPMFQHGAKTSDVTAEQARRLPASDESASGVYDVHDVRIAQGFFRHRVEDVTWIPARIGAVESGALKELLARVWGM
jgi:hypothetical protein